MQHYVTEYVKHRGVDAISITAPEVLCVYDEKHRNDFLAMILTIDGIAKSHSKVLIDLSYVKSMSAAGAVALFSVITSNQIVMNLDDLFVFKMPSDSSTKRLIYRSGLWDAIRPGGKRKLEKLWDTNSRFRSGFDPDKHLEPMIDSLDMSIVPKRLKEAINEAVLNIVQHAYAETGSVPRWWQYAAFNVDKTQFIFVICDRGLTIPRSLKNIYGTDSSIIERGMTSGVSSTGLTWRGKGSDNIKKPVEKDDDDILIVLSRKGLYKYASRDESPKCVDLVTPFPGTLVAWCFDLTK
ncbi:hypothetical protein EDB70_11411 [Vibrio crassostreae]|uniref:hypothetical protein n=1 Tax=Vibrio crassostreae TaxID=246167 RepID=UPI001044ABCF|nr:hypothetical protein [Vibrio crassostreae]TCV22099.1 hypothetical protein EDB70_11411 [Vibrio crassostreae]